MISLIIDCLIDLVGLCVIVAAAAFEDQLTDEGRLRSWCKGDLIDRKGGLKGGYKTIRGSRGSRSTDKFFFLITK